MIKAKQCFAKPRHSTAFCGAVAFMAAQMIFQPAQASTEQRLLRLERLMDNGLLSEWVQRVDTLDQELRELRGRNERLEYELESFKRRQDTLYQDTDARLQALESGGDGGVVAVPSVSRERSRVSNEAQTAAPALVEHQPREVASFATEQSMYNEGIGLLKERRYDKAIAMFTEQLKAFPDGQYAANALYWRGETYYVQRNFAAAIESLQAVEQRFPSSSKVADALLKLGYALYEQRDFDQARSKLETVANRFANTTSAGLAQQRLNRMDAERR